MLSLSIGLNSVCQAILSNLQSLGFRIKQEELINGAICVLFGYE